MLTELKEARQVSGEPPRRWFCDDTFDLIVWYSPEKSILGFQLCYRELAEERALTWFEDSGFSHSRVDDGEDRPARAKMTPILVPDGVFDGSRVGELFRQASAEMDQDVATFVLETIAGYPG